MIRTLQSAASNMASSASSKLSTVLRERIPSRHRRGGGKSLDVGGLVLRIVMALSTIIVAILLAKLYYRNLEKFPPLLTTPFRGANFDPYPNNEFPRKRTLPTVNRANGPEGLTLPYAKNNLALLPDRVRMPNHNTQNRMSIMLWVKAENIAESYAAESEGVEPYAYLVAMNYATKSVSSDPNAAPLDPTNLSILYNSSENDLVVRVRASSQLSLTQEFHLPNALKLQKWQMLTIALDNRDLDVYIDDSLQRSFLLSNVPLLGSNTWTLFPGMIPFHGTLTCIRFFDYALNHHEVQRLYRKHRSKDLPSMSFLLWWTWMPTTAFSRLFTA